MKRWCFFGIPQIGGIYTVYRYLREGLKDYGIEVCWLGGGYDAETAVDKQSWVVERTNGTIVGLSCQSEKELAEVFVKYLADENFDGVFINVLADRVQTNIARYLPAHIRRILIVHSITPATYAAARSVRDFVHATVGVSPRIRDDLVVRFGFQPERTFCIPNGINLELFKEHVRQDKPSANNPIRLVFFGRIEDTAKGVLWLPKILSHLYGIDFLLTVAGDGPDLDKLKTRSQAFSNQVVFVGNVSSADVPALLAIQDVMIFPSRFEGLGLTLVEALAAGCVPVASRIRGVTDFVVKDGETGWLFTMGNCREAANHIRRLAEDRSLLQQASSQAQNSVGDRFSLVKMAQTYANTIDLAALKELPKKPLPLAEWSIPRGLKAGMRTFLPVSVKNFLRMVKDRIDI